MHSLVVSGSVCMVLVKCTVFNLLALDAGVMRMMVM